jgi:hypothetical protein
MVDYLNFKMNECNTKYNTKQNVCVLLELQNIGD